MREIARVTRIDGTRVTVKGGEFSGCFGCMSQECRENGNLFEAENKGGFEVKEGSLVEVALNPAVALLQAMIVLGVPVVVFIMCYVAAFAIWPFSGEGLHAALGLVGLALASVAIYFLRGKYPATVLPVVLRLVEEAELEAKEVMGGAAEPESPTDPQP